MTPHHVPPLFCVPDVAPEADTAPAVVGGLGSGGFSYTPAGEFRGWRLEDGAPAVDVPVVADAFWLWVGERQRAQSRPLTGVPRRRRQLFPFTWDCLDLADVPVDVASLCFSPIIRRSLPESTLPLCVFEWRVRNSGAAPVEAALMLTWVCGWPTPVRDAGFDYQHDNLCLTGSLGSSHSPNRVGIALPDLHSEGIYLQGIEPWCVPDDLDAVVADFADDGEVQTASPGCRPLGAAAWVKFDLRPGETKELPFAVCWHFPAVEAGPGKGSPRPYTQYLGKRRPDNAIVWLAEQAVQDFGAETRAYRYWAQDIEDGQREDLDTGDAAAPALLNARFGSLHDRPLWLDSDDRLLGVSSDGVPSLVEDPWRHAFGAP